MDVAEYTELGFCDAVSQLRFSFLGPIYEFLRGVALISYTCCPTFALVADW